MEFRDLKRQYNCLKTDIDRQIAEVIASASFISGEKVGILEKELAAYAGVRHCISCGNGTDAISIALMAYKTGPGDAVFVPDFTFFSSAECPAALGAVPVFTDVSPDTYNMDPDSLEKAVKRVKREGKYHPKAVIAVDLFGLAPDYEAIRKICKKYGLLLLEDGAQGFGGRIGEKQACSFGDVSTTSFFPAKPLGCYGDGGAIFTDDDEAARLCRSIAVHGKNADDKYDNVRLGMNSRLDTLQAGILLAKLKAFREYELERINQAAAWYTEKLKEIKELVLPEIPKGYYSSWAQYTVRLPEETDRLKVRSYLRESGIPAMVYYAKPLHRQGVFTGTYSSLADCPVTEKLCRTVLCLPMHPYLKEEETEFVADRLKKALKRVAESEKNDAAQERR